MNTSRFNSSSLGVALVLAAAALPELSLFRSSRPSKPATNVPMPRMSPARAALVEGIVGRAAERRRLRLERRARWARNAGLI